MDGLNSPRKSDSSRNNLRKNSFYGSNNQLTNETIFYTNGPGPGKYARSSSIGHMNHDVTLSRNPAFTIGKASRLEPLNRDFVNPGPGAYSYEKYSNPFKRSIPSYSIPKARRFTHYVF